MRSLFKLIKSDFRRFTQTFTLRGQSYSKWRVFLESVFFKAGFQAVLLYRISHWLYECNCIYPAWFFSRLNQFCTGAEIEFNARIGPGMFIAHPGGIVIGRGAEIGSGFTIFQGVSIIVKSWHPDAIGKFPKIGNDCYLFAGAAVMGDISIGNNCIVAAHAVVTRHMPDGSLAVGVPAEIIPEKGNEQIRSWFPDTTTLE